MFSKVIRSLVLVPVVIVAGTIVDKMAPTGVNTDGWRLIKQDDNHFWFGFGGGSFNGLGGGLPAVARDSSTTPGPFVPSDSGRLCQRVAVVCISLDGTLIDPLDPPDELVC